MKQAVSSPRTSYRRVPYSVMKDANGGSTEAMALIQRHWEPYIRRLATVSVRGMTFLNNELYDRLKTRLIMATLKFEI